MAKYKDTSEPVTGGSQVRWDEQYGDVHMIDLDVWGGVDYGVCPWSQGGKGVCGDNTNPETRKVHTGRGRTT